MTILISEFASKLRLSQLVKRGRQEFCDFNNCLAGLLSEVYQIRCMVVRCACDLWFSAVMSFSWLANVELYAAVIPIKLQCFYYCGTWCKFVHVSVLSNSWQIVVSDMGFSLRTNSS
jgi:hypothetical protein